MAEKYGEIPKRFTKKWWGYFWDYYKIHTIVVIVVILIGIFTLNQAINAPKYDFNVSYAGEYLLRGESAELLRQKLSEFVTDSDGNGQDGIALNQNSFVDGAEDPQTLRAKAMRMQLEITDKNTIIFIFDDTKAPYFLVDPAMEGAFMEANEWLNKKIDEDRMYVTDGKAFAVSLKGSKLLEECGIRSENLYIAMRNYSDEELDEEMQEKIADAKNIANAIIE